MNRIYKYILFFGTCVIIGLAAWYFQNIVTYILVSSVLSLIGSPIIHYLSKLRIGKFSIPKSLSAGLTLLIFWLIFIAFFRYFVPLLALEAQKLSQIDVAQVLHAVKEPLTKIDDFVNRTGLNGSQPFSLFDILSSKISSVINIGLFTDIFSSIAGTLGNIFIALFSISFITFFFLKDEGLFNEGVILFVPTRHEEAARRVLSSTKQLLMRYFVGISAQITGIIILVTIGLLIAGIEFKTCLVIALFAGVINVIPYIGPLIGTIFALVIGLASKVDMIYAGHFGALLVYILIVFAITHLIDNIVFQPVIFSNSVKAHPLEIFLVILIAGHIGGITGMLVAIPGYTVIRVFAKQFLNNFKVVKKLTEKI